MNVANEWYKNCEDYILINDNLCGEDKEFVAHRHDQSIYSAVVNKIGSIKLKDETYYQNWETDGFRLPFWARRIK